MATPNVNTASIPTPNIASPSTPTSQLVDPAGAAVGPVFTPSGFTFGNIMDAFNKAKAQGGVVQLLPDGYDISAAGQGIPTASGVLYQGSGWTLNFVGVPDASSATPASGTWIYGNGAFPAFVGNSIDGSNAYASQAAFAQAGINQCGIRAIGVSNCSHGAKIGSNYNPGSFYSIFDDLIALGCGWGFHWENSLHNEYGRIYALNCSSGGIRWRSSATSSILQPANCKVREAVVTVPSGSFLARGIVLSCANGTIGGLYQADILQSNRFGATTSSQTATTNGTTTVAVSDTSKYAVGMPVAFSALGGATGLVVNQIYFITAIVANTSIQIANAPLGSSLSPGAGSPTIKTQGMPCIEVVIDDTTAGNALDLPYVAVMDMEAGGTCKAIFQNLSVGMSVNIFAAPAGSTQDVCVRNSNVPIQIQPLAGSINIDTSDGNSNEVQLLGFQPAANSLGPTFGIRGTPSQKSLNLSLVSGGKDTLQALTVGGFDILYPNVALCQLTQYGTTGSLGLIPQYAGCIPFSGSSPSTFTLPTITAGMNGLPFEVPNMGSATLTLTATAGQGFNATSRTSLTINAGASVKVRAVWTGSAGFWSVVGIGGTYSAGTISTI